MTRKTTTEERAWRRGRRASLLGSAVFWLFLGAGGCANPALEQPQEATESDELSLGASGERVRMVNDYLLRRGFFPNDELVERYPEWVPPVAEAPASQEVFDERTLEAVEYFQREHGLEITGSVDAKSLELMSKSLCSHPVQTPEGADNKWHHDAEFSAPYPLGGTYTYRVVGMPSSTVLSASQVLAAVDRAFDTWESQAGVSFVRSSSSNTHAVVEFANLGGGTAWTFNNGWGGQRHSIQVNSTLNWGTPGLNLDLVLLHEVGHLLGFNHSGFSSAVMFPSGPADGVANLDDDDRGALASRYRQWSDRPGVANDIGVGPAGTWVVGNTPKAGGFTIHRFNGSSWTLVSGDAMRIAVGRAPWVVNAQGRIYRRQDVFWFNPLGSSWEEVSNGARAIDIGIGDDDNAWAISTQTVGTGGNAILRFTGTGWQTVPGAALRISVGQDGTVYVVNALGRVFRRAGITPTTPSGTSWLSLPSLAPNLFGNETGVATDVGVSRSGVAWVAGTASGTPYTFLRQDQPASPPGMFAQPAQAFSRWLPIPGGAVNIDAHVVSNPWLTSPTRQIQERTQ